MQLGHRAPGPELAFQIEILANKADICNLRSEMHIRAGGTFQDAKKTGVNLVFWLENCAKR